MPRPQLGPTWVVHIGLVWEIKFRVFPAKQRPESSWEETQVRTKRQISGTSQGRVSKGPVPRFSKTCAMKRLEADQVCEQSSLRHGGGDVYHTT